LSCPPLLASAEPPVPEKVYPNSDACKDQILLDNKNKSGIYMWKNNLNKKRYIGSSQNLRKRFTEYFNINSLIKDNCMPICRALKKHDYSNFELTILEYCSPDKCIEREKYYINFLGSEYNIVKDPTLPSMSGRTHSDATKIIMSDAKKGENHPNYGKPRFEGAGRPSQSIEVFDLEEKISTSYDSIRSAARALNLPSHKAILNYIKNNQQKPYKGRYNFKKVQKN